MIISHNLLAMNANRQFNITGRRQKKNIEKLSSGYRINRASDDAAGLAISEKMRRQMRGLNKGLENTQDGISLCQIADGALNEVHDMLHRLEELSVKAANGTNTESDRQAIQEEIDQILSEIDRISATSTFNEQNIFGRDERTASSAGTAQAQSNGTAGSRAAQIQSYSAAGNRAVQAYGALQDATGSNALKTYLEMQEAAESSTLQTFVKMQEDAAGSEVQAYGAAQEAEENSAVRAISDVAPLAEGTQCGAFTVIGGVLGTDYEYDAGSQELRILSNAAITIQNTNPAATIDRIVITADAGDANITLAGVNIDVSSTSKAALEIDESNTGNVTITLADGTTNTLKGGNMCAGLQKNGENGFLTINGSTGKLEATGGYYGAGIGGGMSHHGSNITINGGEITAQGGAQGGAGIGGGWGIDPSNNTAKGGNGINITINGGNVVAKGGDGAAGIGGGRDGNGRNITIRGGRIEARGGLLKDINNNDPANGGAGIGGGSGGAVGGDSNTIIIEGGYVEAHGAGCGAGIGGGRAGNSNNIVISGGTVKATGGENGGAGIGGGGQFPGQSDFGGGESDNITISDAVVEATGGNASADAIGAGSNSAGNGSTGKSGTVDIEDSLVFEGTAGSNKKKGTVYGDVTIDEDLTIDQDTTLEVGKDSSLTIDDDATLTNNGTIVNNGDIIIEEDGTLTNNGTIINNGNIYKRGGTINGSGSITGNAPIDVVGGSRSWWIHCGVESGVGLFIEIESIDTVTLGISDMDVTTEEGAGKAIDMVSRALRKVSSVRSNIGAQQNRLEHTINNESNIVENTTAAESRIRDADIAKEMVELSMVNILAQAGTSMLTQANTINDGALMLLR